MAHYLTPRQIANELGVTERSVLRWIALGRLRAYRPSPRVTRIRPADYRAFLEGMAAPEMVDDGFDALPPAAGQFEYQDHGRAYLVAQDDEDGAPAFVDVPLPVGQAHRGSGECEACQQAAQFSQGTFDTLDER